jgi:hypothetical protein
MEKCVNEEKTGIGQVSTPSYPFRINSGESGQEHIFFFFNQSGFRKLVIVFKLRKKIIFSIIKSEISITFVEIQIDSWN